MSEDPSCCPVHGLTAARPCSGRGLGNARRPASFRGRSKILAASGSYGRNYMGSCTSCTCRGIEAGSCPGRVDHGRSGEVVDVGETRRPRLRQAPTTESLNFFLGQQMLSTPIQASQTSMRRAYSTEFMASSCVPKCFFYPWNLAALLVAHGNNSRKRRSWRLLPHSIA